MLAIVTLIALLSFAEASRKTPRTAIPSSLGSPSTTTTLATMPSVTTIVPSSTPSAQLNTSSPTPRLTSAGAATSRCTTLLLAAPTSTSISTQTAIDPEITPSPELPPPGANFHEIGVKYVQTTYYSCVTFPLETHCGWHEPILDAGASGIRCEGSGQVALRAGVVAGIVAGGLILGL
ncbi:hypothetical protein F4813DRAFT_241312 [Daldinia decipiens]|uniref:uncharacterized protein n=1 Tax=Daldinia decipiens TaxID=326647 RepID=UPI0020C390EA|nr:uncharacterized protein F4813DRAFT_241312 [Daldinia decipiens]KAI1653843.1 hypothetical protein F4813DRAFT_241312 [Daldinia decipiens]